METKSFVPVWHPTEAKNYFTLYNNVNRTNQIVYYDTTNAFINYPKTFYYERTNSNNNYLLTKITTNTNSDNATFGANSTSTKGNFNINKIAPNSGSSEPSIDLYCCGDIQIIKTYDIDEHAYGDVYIDSINPSTFDYSINNYGLNKQLNINYSTYYDFDSGYEYSSMWIRATINWGKDGNGNLIYNGSANSSGTLTLAVPSSYVSNIIPTITMWMQLYSKQSSEPGPGESWTATAVGDHATYDESTGKYISLFNGTSVYVDGVSGDSRHGSWSVWENWYGVYEWITVSAWISKDWINPSDNPN